MSEIDPTRPPKSLTGKKIAMYVLAGLPVLFVLAMGAIAILQGPPLRVWF